MASTRTLSNSPSSCLSVRWTFLGGYMHARSIGNRQPEQSYLDGPHRVGADTPCSSPCFSPVERPLHVTSSTPILSYFHRRSRLPRLLNVLVGRLLVLGTEEATVVPCEPLAELVDLLAKSIHRLCVHVGLRDHLWQVDYFHRRNGMGQYKCERRSQDEERKDVPSIRAKCSAPYASPGPFPTQSG